MVKIESIISQISPKRMSSLSGPPACLMSEAKHVENLAFSLVKSLPLNIRTSWIYHDNASILPIAMAQVLTKPTVLGSWTGQETSIVLNAKRHPELEGMILNRDGVCLRPIFGEATWPSTINFPTSSEYEGGAVNALIASLGFKSFGFDENISYLFPLLFKKSNIEVGEHFYSNIKIFTDYLTERRKNPWDRSN